MPKTTRPSKVPAGPASDEPHTIDNLRMTSDRTSGGFRLLYRQTDGRISGPATVCYCIEHPQDHEYTVITPTLTKRGSQDWFRGRICQRSQKMDPPQVWGEALWTAWLKGGAEAVQKQLHNFVPHGGEVGYE